MNPTKAPYQVHVFKDYLKFSAAHFIAYKGFREPLHGHNYQVSVRVEGSLGADGYVLDFGVVKQAAKRICEPSKFRHAVYLKCHVEQTVRAMTYAGCVMVGITAQEYQNWLSVSVRVIGDAKAERFAIEIQALCRISHVDAEVAEPANLERLFQQHAANVELSVAALCRSTCCRALHHHRSSLKSRVKLDTRDSTLARP